MHNAIEQRILDLLGSKGETLTASFIYFSLEDCTFDEVVEALGTLSESGAITMGYLGYSLRNSGDTVDDSGAVIEDAPEGEALFLDNKPISSYEAIAAALEVAGEDKGLEEYSDVPFIGAREASFHDETELLYAKLKGTTAGEGLEDYPDDACIGAEAPAYEANDEELSSPVDTHRELDELVGTSPIAQNRSRSQEQDEFQALLDLVLAESIDNDEPDKGSMPKPEECEDVEDDAPSSVFTCWTPIIHLKLSSRTRTALSQLSIATVRNLVEHYDSLGQLHGAGIKALIEVRESLLSHSTEMPREYDADLVCSLINISGSKEFVFDAFGHLMHIPSSIVHNTDSLSGGDAVRDLSDSRLPIGMLDLPKRLLNALIREGYTTIGEVSKLTRDELLSLRGVGEGAVYQLEDTLRRTDPSSLEAAAAQTNASKNQPSTYAALEGNQTPIEKLGFPNRLLNALRNQGYKTLGDISGLSDNQILSFKGLGALSVYQFNEVMNRLSAANGFDRQASSQPTDADSAKEMPTDGQYPESIHLGSNELNERQAHVSVAACEGARLALEECGSSRYPVFNDSFLAIMPYEALNRIGDSHASAEEYRDAILSALESSEELLFACMRTLSEKVDASRSTSSNMEFIEEICLPGSPIWDEAARQLSESSEYCSYDFERHSLAIVHPSISDWVESSIENRMIRTILKMFLRGSTLEACGKEVGLTRERVRQIVSKRLLAAPSVEENRYRYFYEIYRPSKAEFLALTGQPMSTYVYLHTTAAPKQQNSRTLSDALTDEHVPQQVRDGIRRFLDKDFVYEDGYRIHIDRVSIINHIAMRHASSRLIKVQRLKELYDQFLDDHGLSQTKPLPFGSMHNFEAYIDRCEMILKLPHSAEEKYGGSVRYYDSPAMDFEPLIDLINFGELGDVECSTAMLMHLEGFPEVLEDLDIRNEYELHYVLSRYCPKLGKVSFGRSPIITFGKGSRDTQVLELIKELSPVSASDLAEAYSKRYGVDTLTFKGSFLAGFDIYLKNGKYVYNSQGLDGEQSAFIAEQLGESNRGYLSTALLKARFAARFPDASTSLINGESISAFGFHPSAGLLFRNGINERKLFGDLLDSKQRFSIDDEGFGKDVFDNPSFRAELAIRVRACKLVEFEKNSFLSSRILSSIDIDIDETDLKDYVDCAIEFMAADRPYTVQRLRSEGFSHKVDVLRDEFGLEDFFFASLLATGTVGGRLKMTTIGEATVFCKTFYGYSAPVLVEQIIGEDGAMEIDDLIYLLEDDYDIHESATVLRSIVKRSDLYFNETLDMVFGSEETYRRKAREWIS